MIRGKRRKMAEADTLSKEKTNRGASSNSQATYGPVIHPTKKGNGETVSTKFRGVGKSPWDIKSGGNSMKR